MRNFFIQWAIGTATGLGLVFTGLSLDMFEATRGFWCWLLNPFLDLIQTSVCDLFLQGTFGAGGFLDMTSTRNLLNAVGKIQAYCPMLQLFAMLGVYVSFLCFWVPIRFVLRMLPGVF